MSTIDRRYADLLAEDPTLGRLIDGLDRAYSADAPPALRERVYALAGNSVAVAQASRLRSAWPVRIGSRRRVTILGSVALAAALLGGAAAADVGPVEWAMSLLTGTGQTGSPIQGQAMNLSQTVCGYTVTLSRVYADANRVVVGYSISGPAGRTFNSLTAGPTLSDGQGDTLPAMEGAGGGVENTASGAATVFDASAITDIGNQIRLHLTFPSIQAVEPSGNSPPTGACERVVPDGQIGKAVPANQSGAVDQAGQDSAPQVRIISVTGPFSFDFVAPVTPGRRVLEVNQTLTSSHGTTVSLEKIVVTPSEARLYLTGPDIANLAGGPPIAPTLYVGGQVVMDGVQESRPLGGGREIDSIVGDLYNKQGDWAVKVLTDPTMQNGYRQYTDSVTFHVTMP